MIRFRCGEGGGTTIVCHMTNDNVTISRDLSIGTAYQLRCNTIRSTGDNDLVFKRNDVEFMRFMNVSGSITYDLISLDNTVRLSTNHFYTNNFISRTNQTDTIFTGSMTTGSERVEYMRWNYASQQLDFSAPIDATGYDITGNLINTGVSDKRLKTNIQDIDDANYSDCVKNVKLKTFEFKDKKFENQDNYGMIAQDLLENLPKEFKSIVRQNIPKKDGEKEYLSINYMKINIILWGALQEQMEIISKLESRLFEAEDEIKALKGKGKAKSKAKSKNVD